MVELDALEAIYPGALGDIVKKALDPYYDKDKVEELDRENRRMRLKAEQMIEDKLRKPLNEALEEVNVQGIANGFELTKVIDPTFTPPEPGHDGPLPPAHGETLGIRAVGKANHRK